jgi:hypothetical protein
MITLANGQQYGITLAMTGKMKGMWSLNTSPTINPFCLKQREDKTSICAVCYSDKSEKRWKNTRGAWARNGKTLATNDLQGKEIPFFKTREIFRFQAHGDLINVTHYLNLMKIAAKNPHVTFCLWTKNLEVVEKAGLQKRENVIYIYSTPKLNEAEPFVPFGFDHAFSVYTKPYIEENGIDINCGAKHCDTCRLCYTHNGIRFINEIVK